LVLKSDEGYSDITSFLAVGKADTHGGPTLKQLKEEHKVEVVVDLNDEKSEAQQAKRAGLRYVGKKVPMVPAPSVLESLSKTIDREVMAGQRVFVHCHQGVYRAPTVAVAYLIYKGMKTEDAVKLVKNRRPLALPGLEDSKRLMPALRDFENRVRTQHNASK